MRWEWRWNYELKITNYEYKTGDEGGESIYEKYSCG